MVRSAKDFFQPLALGAPTPLREIPVRPSRMIHFFDPSNPKMASKVPDMAKKCALSCQLSRSRSRIFKYASCTNPVVSRVSPSRSAWSFERAMSWSSS